MINRRIFLCLSDNMRTERLLRLEAFYQTMNGLSEFLIRLNELRIIRLMRFPSFCLKYPPLIKFYCPCFTIFFWGTQGQFPVCGLQNLRLSSTQKLIQSLHYLWLSPTAEHRRMSLCESGDILIGLLRLESFYQTMLGHDGFDELQTNISLMRLPSFCLKSFPPIQL